MKLFNPSNQAGTVWAGHTTRIATACAAFMVAAFAHHAWAQPEGGGPPKMPPAEALAACKSLASGKECSFSTPRGSVIGSCWAPEGKPLACRPANAPMQPAGQKPPEK